MNLNIWQQELLERQQSKHHRGNNELTMKARTIDPFDVEYSTIAKWLNSRNVCMNQECICELRYSTQFADLAIELPGVRLGVSTRPNPS